MTGEELLSFCTIVVKRECQNRKAKPARSRVHVLILPPLCSLTWLFPVRADLAFSGLHSCEQGMSGADGN